MRAGPTLHGGDLSGIRRAYPHAQKPWIDLSTGINPQAYPVPEISPDIWQNLPDVALLDGLYRAAAGYYGVGVQQLTAAPGTQALIQWLPFLRAQINGVGRIGVVGPTYAEHALCWQRAGHQVRQIALEDTADTECDVVVLVNPNNPDGRLCPGADLIPVAERLAARGGWLVLDEAFMDCNSENSFCALLSGRANVIILRSFGKFFGLAGLRLGFAIGAPELVMEIAALIGPWAVSGMACAVGARALQDQAWIVQTRARLHADGQRRDAILVQHGMRIAGSHPLFSLVYTPYADQLFVHLAQSGIYARLFDTQPYWLRIGALADGTAEKRLSHCLHVWKNRQ